MNSGSSSLQSAWDIEYFLWGIAAATVVVKAHFTGACPFVVGASTTAVSGFTSSSAASVPALTAASCSNKVAWHSLKTLMCMAVFTSAVAAVGSALSQR